MVEKLGFQHNLQDAFMFYNNVNDIGILNKMAHNSAIAATSPGAGEVARLLYENYLLQEARQSRETLKQEAFNFIETDPQESVFSNNGDVDPEYVSSSLAMMGYGFGSESSIQTVLADHPDFMEIDSYSEGVDFISEVLEQLFIDGQWTF